MFECTYFLPVFRNLSKKSVWNNICYHTRALPFFYIFHVSLSSTKLSMSLFRSNSEEYDLFPKKYDVTNLFYPCTKYRLAWSVCACMFFPANCESDWCQRHLRYLINFYTKILIRHYILQAQFAIIQEEEKKFNSLYQKILIRMNYYYWFIEILGNRTTVPRKQSLIFWLIT